MTTNSQVIHLSQALDEHATILAENERCLAGKQPLAFLSSAARDAVKLARMASNLPNVQVTVLAERLRVPDLTEDGKHDPDLWADFQRNDRDQLLPLAFREALGLGSAYASSGTGPAGRGRR